MTTTFGATSAGFVRKQFTDILESISARQLARVSKSLLTKSEKTVIGNWNNIYADELSQCWEALEIAYNGFDPANAIQFLLSALAGLTGVTARGSQPGTVTANVTVSSGVDYAAGAMVASVTGQSANQWSNISAFNVVIGGTYPVLFKSNTLGSKAVAPLGQLTVIATPLTGWVSVTNPADGVPGADAETIEQVRIRRDESLAASGVGTLPAVTAAVSRVPGVVAVKGKENNTNVAVGALPAHSIRIVAYATASDADIAQTLLNAAGGGITTAGTTTVNAVNSNGDIVPTSFTRATVIAVTIAAVVVSANGFDLAAAKAALLAVQPGDIDQDVLISRLSAALIGVQGIDDVVSIALTPAGSPNLVIDDVSIAQFNPGTMTVTT